MEGRYIKPFDFNHIIYLLIMLIFIILLIVFKEKIKKNHRKIARVIVTVSIIQQFLLYGSYFFIEGFTLGESLPLHISRINTILGIIYLITNSKKLVPFISYLSVFALLSFIVPSKIDPISHPLGVSYLVNHIITLLLPYFAMLGGHYPKKEDMKKSYYFFLAYFLFVLLINPLIDGNYFYLVDKPILKNLANGIYIPLNLIVVLILFYLESLFFEFIQVRIKGLNIKVELYFLSPSYYPY